MNKGIVYCYDWVASWSEFGLLTLSNEFQSTTVFDSRRRFVSTAWPRIATVLRLLTLQQLIHHILGGQLIVQMMLVWFSVHHFLQISFLYEFWRNLDCIFSNCLLCCLLCRLFWSSWIHLGLNVFRVEFMFRRRRILLWGRLARITLHGC